MRFVRVVCIIVILINIIGCSSEIERYSHNIDPSDYGSSQVQKAQKGKIHTFGTNHVDEKQHINNTIAYSNELSQAVSSIEGVGDARVFVTDKNVYVSVVLDYTGRGYAKSKAYMYQDASSGKDAYPSASQITNNPFKNYISVNDPTQLTDAFKQRIADTIFAKETHAEEVHISANLDFMYYMDEFAQAAWANEELDRYINQFNIVVQYQFANGKIFPDSLKHYRG